MMIFSGSIIFNNRIFVHMERSKKLARDGLVELGFSVMYLAPPTPRPTRRRGHRGFISAGSNDPFGFDAIAVSDAMWHGVQATEEGHASDRRHKVDVGFPTQPPNTLVDVWEYIFRRDEKDARKLVYRINLSRRFNLGTRDAPALEWFLLKDGKWKHVAVRGDERSNGALQGRKQGVFASMRYVPKAALGWVHMNADDHVSSKDGSALETETPPGVPGETGIGKVVR